MLRFEQMEPGCMRWVPSLIGAAGWTDTFYLFTNCYLLLISEQFCDCRRIFLAAEVHKCLGTSDNRINLVTKPLLNLFCWYTIGK